MIVDQPSPERAEQSAELSLTARRSAVLTAVAVAVAVAGVLALRLAGQHLEVAGRDGTGPVPLGAVVVATAVGGLAGHALARLAERAARPRRTFLVLVAAGLSLSAVPTTAAATVRTAVWLLVLHALVAAVVVPPLARALPSSRSAPAPRTPGPGRRTAGAAR